jgi:hypothetical protein
MNNGWALLNESPVCIDELKKICSSLNYETTFNRLFRAGVPKDLNTRICDYYDLDLHVGIYKTPPGWRYKFHTDNTRNCAINQLLTEQISEYTGQMIIDGVTHDIPYSMDVPCLINTALPHNVQNNSIAYTRYLLNIHVYNFITFDIVKTHLINKGLITI